MKTSAITHGGLVLAGLAVVSCAAATGQTSAESATRAPALRQHPSDHAMTRAFERVRDEALRCLRPGDRTRVRGAFEGNDGAFEVNGIESSNGPLPFAIETCVRVAAEHAHVRPFQDEQAAFTFAFESPAATTPGAPAADGGALPMFGSDGGVYPASTAGGSGTPSPGTTPTPGLATGTMTIGSHPAPVDLIRRESDALQRCYEQACERDHTISGRIELRFTLDGSGRISRLATRVETQAEDASLMDLVAHCIESHVRLIQFGPQSFPSQDIVVPLAFQPGGIPID